MNIALLYRLRANSSTPAEAIELSKRALRNARFVNHAETVFYLSANDPQEFYILSFWWEQGWELQEVLAQNNVGLIGGLQNKFELVEQLTFKLSWEYRLLSQTASVSHLQLTTFPAGYSQPMIDQLILDNRQRLHVAPASVGAWLGRSLPKGGGNPLKEIVLSRADWSDLTAQLEYVGSQVLYDCRRHRRAEGIKIEYASLSLHSMLEPPV